MADTQRSTGPSGEPGPTAETRAARQNEPGKATGGDRRNLVGSVLKVVELVEAFLGGPTELTLTELTSRTGYPMPTVHRLLATLEHARWVTRGRNGGYSLSIHMAEIAGHVLSGIDLRSTALDVMQELTRQTGETSYLMVSEADRAVCIERVESYRMIRIMSLDVGASLPLWAGAAPLTLLAYEPDDLADAVLRSVAMKRPDGSEHTPETIEASLETFRRRGFSTSTEDWIPGIGSVGAPVFGTDGRIAAAVSVGGLVTSLMAERLDDVAGAVRQAGERISRSIGYRGPYPPADGRRVPRPRPHD